MSYVIVTIAAFIAGGACVFIALEQRRREALRLAAVRSELDQARMSLENDRVAVQRLEAETRFMLQNERKAFDATVSQSEADLLQRQEQLNAAQQAFDKRVIQYDELANENLLLKRDMCQLQFLNRKQALDVRHQEEQQAQVKEMVNDVGRAYLKDTVKWIGSALNSKNFETCKQRLVTAISRCRGMGLDLPNDEESKYVEDLKEQFKLEVRAELQREEQSRIRAQIREEQAREKEMARLLEQEACEQEVIQAALAKALAEAHGQHSVEVERLKEQLAEAEAKHQRTMSQAQLTKTGNVYVISNLGSFGEGVFKIGMTRRLEPVERIEELGDASVPFPFDIHAMLASDDAPALENALHRALHNTRINRINLRKEFFRTSIDEIVKVARQHHGDVQYVADAEALEYRQSIEMSDEDFHEIEEVFDEVGDASGIPVE